MSKLVKLEIIPDGELDGVIHDCYSLERGDDVVFCMLEELLVRRRAMDAVAEQIADRCGSVYGSRLVDNRILRGWVSLLRRPR